jgi:hypothetical protein
VVASVGAPASAFSVVFFVDVTTAATMVVATSTAEIAMRPRCRWADPGKSGRVMPSANRMIAQATSTLPATKKNVSLFACSAARIVTALWNAAPMAARS